MKADQWQGLLTAAHAERSNALCQVFAVGALTAQQSKRPCGVLASSEQLHNLSGRQVRLGVAESSAILRSFLCTVSFP
jgi:hypothetical protein